MKSALVPVLSLCLLSISIAVAPAAPQDPSQDPDKMQAAMKEMMEKAAKFTKPGKHHKALERFLGTWDVTLQFFAGERPMPPEKGTCEWAWLMPGRWLRSDIEGQMMNMPAHLFSVLGYDNFKMSYVWTGINSIDTAMNRAEGDMTPDDKAMILYGTLDEYTTGEHDKMVKYAFRFLSADKIVCEVHDLPIGEQHAKVLEITYTRKK